MRRLPRHLFTILTAVSLLLCVAMAVLWVRSYSISDQVGWVRGDRAIAIASSAGSLAFLTDRLTGAAALGFVRPQGFSHYHLRQVLDLTNSPMPGLTAKGFAGFHLIAGRSGPRTAHCSF